LYDPAITGKQAVTQGNAGQGDRHVGNKNASQNYPAGQGACSAGGGRHNSILGIQHKFMISNNKVPGTRCSIKEEVSLDIGKMTEILPLRGQDISNPSNSSTSSMISSSRSSRSSSDKI
jgi:hypothetical protein